MCFDAKVASVPSVRAWVDIQFTHRALPVETSRCGTVLKGVTRDFPIDLTRERIAGEIMGGLPECSVLSRCHSELDSAAHTGRPVAVSGI